MFSSKQVFPVNYEEEVSQRLLEACHSGDQSLALECIGDPSVDINFVGAVSLKIRKAELILHNESASEVRLEFEESKTDVTALFLAVHAGNANLVKKLLVMQCSEAHFCLFIQIAVICLYFNFSIRIAGFL